MEIMFQERYFKIHDFFSFSFAGKKQELSYLTKQYAFYEVFEKPTKLDLTIHIGPFPNPLSSGQRFYTVNRKYYVGFDSLYVKDRYKTAFWKLFIKGLGDQQVNIYFQGNSWSHMLLYKFIVEPILRYRLNEKALVMLHSSCIADDLGAIIFPASPSVGKTNSMINWLCRGKLFIGDEYTILASKKVYGYVTPLRLHSYNLEASPVLKKTIPGRDRLQIWWRSFLLKATLGYGDITHEVPLQTALPKVTISPTASLRALVLLTKTNVNKVTPQECQKEEILKKLITINRFETAYRFNEYFDAYFYSYPGHSTDQFWAKMRRNLEKILEDVPCFEVLMPYKYQQDTFRRLDAFVKELKN